uniref:C2H2-type domain-containing protein n=1 Tax=Hyaloperonospora arabidopsidis (strain Emoy2) TaxID=559515 RepID=M4B573_HYAAE
MSHSSGSNESLPRFFGSCFQCSECPRQFTRRYALQEHLVTHTGEKAYRCPARGCGKCFTTTSNLARHRRLHGDELQPLACPVPSCSKTFTTAHKLQRHMRVHMDTPTRRCKFAHCNKTFSSTGNLNRHMRNQHLRFGHSLAVNTEASQEEQSPTSVDVQPVGHKFTWARDGIATDLHVAANSPSCVSDEELLEVLSCLLDNDDEMAGGGSSSSAFEEALAATTKAGTVKL